MSPYTAERERRKRTRILVVDDQFYDRDIQSEYLRKAGYQVESVQDAAEALEAMAGDTYFDVALVDTDMPGMKGPQLCAEKRRLGYDMTVLIGMSTFDTPERRSAYSIAGADDFIPKEWFTPTDMTYVVEVIDRALHYRSQASYDGQNKITTPELKVPDFMYYDPNSNPLIK
jgi:CheY-like chemotaxis protein